MKALTIRQPYAELIMLGEKRVENRSRVILPQGPFLIHAGLTSDVDGIEKYQHIDATDYGAIVGRADVVACYSIETINGTDIQLGRRGKHNWLRSHDHVVGPWCFVLDNVVRFEWPIPYRGMPGVFVVPESALETERGYPWEWPAGPRPQTCRICGCTEHSPCEGGCWWVESDLCSACVDQAEEDPEE